MSNNTQKKLVGIDATMRRASLSDVVADLVSRHGLTVLANEIDIDKSDLSRFKNGEKGIVIEKVDQLLRYGDMVLIPESRYRRLVETIITLSELAKEGMGI